MGAEIDSALSKESAWDSKLGEAYRFLATEDIPEEKRISQLREHYGHADSGMANKMRATLDAIRFGILTTGKTNSLEISRRISTFLQDHRFSDGAREVLHENRDALIATANNVKVQELEAKRVEEKERDRGAQIRDRPGVYVFTYPHYLDNPTDRASEDKKQADRTLFKVGYSDRDIVERINKVTSGEGIPESRRILRAYLLPRGTTSNAEIERQFHRLLDSAGHQGPKRGATDFQHGGREWFLTSLVFLDTIADVLGLDIEIFDPSDDEI